MVDIINTDFQGDLKFQDSYVDQATALPNATNYTSDSFDFGQVQSALALKIKANGAVTIANGATLKFELYDSADDSSFTLVEPALLDYTNGTGSPVVRADGYEFVNYVPSSSINKFCKVKVTTTTDLSSYSYDAYVHFIAR